LEVHSIVGSGSTFTCHFPPQRVLAEREELREVV